MNITRHTSIVFVSFHPHISVSPHTLNPPHPTADPTLATDQTTAASAPPPPSASVSSSTALSDSADWMSSGPSFNTSSSVSGSAKPAAGGSSSLDADAALAAFLAAQEMEEGGEPRIRKPDVRKGYEDDNSYDEDEMEGSEGAQGETEKIWGDKEGND